MVGEYRYKCPDCRTTAQMLIEPSKGESKCPLCGAQMKKIARKIVARLEDE